MTERLSAGWRTAGQATLLLLAWGGPVCAIFLAAVFRPVVIHSPALIGVVVGFGGPAMVCFWMLLDGISDAPAKGHGLLLHMSLTLDNWLRFLRRLMPWEFGIAVALALSNVALWRVGVVSDHDLAKTAWVWAGMKVVQYPLVLALHFLNVLLLIRLGGIITVHNESEAA